MSYPSTEPELHKDAGAETLRSRARRQKGDETPSPTHRSGKELILATRPYAQDIPGRSWWCVISTGVLLAASLVGAVGLESLWLRAACSVLSGLLALRFFVIYHDQQHHAILDGSRLAEALMQVFGVCALSASSIWRSSHNHHHNHNSRLRGSHIGSFPIMTSDAFGRASQAERTKYLFMRHPLTILFGYVFIFLYGMCINPFLSNPRRHWDCALALVVHVAIAVGLVAWGGWTALVFGQTVPCLILYSLGSYLFYVQHNFPGVAFRERGDWTYEHAALESSSFLKLSPLMHWFTANIGYHHIHHLNARIPFHRLPEAMAAIPELQQPRTSSLSPSAIRECLRLKVWDVKGQKMTGIPS